MKRRFRISFVLLLGILLLGIGLIGLATVPDLMQYAYIPPAKEVSAEESRMAEPVLQKYDDAMASMGEAFPGMTLHGVRSGVKLQNGKTSQGDIYLYAVGPSWNDVYTPRIVKGRPIGRLDAEKNNKVIVLDEQTSFLLFGSDADPVGRTVLFSDGDDYTGKPTSLNGQYLEVVGVAAHSRKIGETGSYAAWVPLGPESDYSLMVASVTAGSMEYYTMFQEQAKKTIGTDAQAGTAISMTREKTMALLPLLVAFVVLAVWILKRLFRRIGEYGKLQIEKVRAESRRRYALQLIPYAAGHLVLPALLIILAVAACYGVAVLAISPLRVFPEWIPETLGEYTSWISRFWVLAGRAAEPVSMKTPELGQMQLWSGLINWGTLLILLYAAKNTLTGAGKRKED